MEYTSHPMLHQKTAHRLVHDAVGSVVLNGWLELENRILVWWFVTQLSDVVNFILYSPYPTPPQFHKWEVLGHWPNFSGQLNGSIFNDFKVSLNSFRNFLWAKHATFPPIISKIFLLYPTRSKKRLINPWNLVGALAIPYIGLSHTSSH